MLFILFVVFVVSRFSVRNLDLIFPIKATTTKNHWITFYSRLLNFVLILFLLMQVCWSRKYPCNGIWMWETNGHQTDTKHPTLNSSMIFVLHAMLIIMVLAAQMCVGRVMINLAIIHAHRPVALFAYQDGKANIVQNVSKFSIFSRWKRGDVMMHCRECLSILIEIFCICK